MAVENSQIQPALGLENFSQVRVTGLEKRISKKLLRCLQNSKEHFARKQRRVSKNGSVIKMKILAQAEVCSLYTFFTESAQSALMAGRYVHQTARFFLKKIVEFCDNLMLQFYRNIYTHTHTHIYIYIYIYIQGVPGGMCQTSGECS